MCEIAANPEAPWALRLVPPFPAVAQRVLALAGNEGAGANAVGRLVQMDPSFSAELLRFANSPLFGARSEVHTLATAINLVGLERVKTMALLVVLNKMVGSALRIGALRKIWIHSLVTAFIADEAARAAHIDRNSAYTAGLLHNLGTLGMMSAFPSEYSRMLEVSDDFGFDLLATERDLFDIDHCAAGAFLARNWDFPEELVNAIAHHHETPAEIVNGLPQLVQISWRFADTLGFAAFSPDRSWEWQELAALLPNTRPSWLTESVEAAEGEINYLLAAAPI